MELICPKEICTGCGLCAVRCPKQCIYMTTEKLGHLYPVISRDLCIDCGLCQKSCPSLQKLECHHPITAFAAWSKDDIDYKTSTSGGIASVLTNYMLANGGVVYGCAMLPGIKVKHIRINNIKDADKLKGSKYVQSSIVDSLTQIRKDVKVGMNVLFIGTPCQVAAVKGMFKELPANLYLIDIICHGVPSNKWLIDYIEQYLYICKENVTIAKFRNNNVYQLCLFDGKNLLYQSKSLWQYRYNNLYMDTFIDSFTSRDSCFTCHYAKSERISDITIGDFWGLGKETDAKYIPQHPFGISCILPISEKGEKLIEAVKNSFYIYERSVTEAVKGNDQLKHPKRKSLRIKIFQCIYGRIGINAAYKLCICDKIPIFYLKKAVKSLLNAL